MNVLCLGASYTGRYAAVKFCKEHSFYFLSRRPGYYPDVEYYTPAKAAQIDCILNTIPPKANTGREPAYHETAAELLGKKANLTYIYISSTAVFPSHTVKARKIFNEESTPAPDTSRGEIRLQMENKILSMYKQAKILRSAGIYGPGRSIAEQFKNGNFFRTRLGNRLVSRIHVHDLLRLAFALAQNRTAPSLIHGVDQETAPYAQVFSFLEKELGIAIPLNADVGHALDWRKSSVQGRIIQSLYARKLLNDKYTFPTYKEGFKAIIETT